MRRGLIALFAATAIGGAAAAEQEAGVGAVTNLPLPRFVSLKAEEANVRRGPGLTHRIDWVFLRRDMPLEILAEHGHWRKVRDVDDATGWIHHAMLKGGRSAVVTAPRTALRDGPGRERRVVAIAESGVIAALERCRGEWCEIEAGGHSGWAPRTDLWGARPGEEFE